MSQQRQQLRGFSLVEMAVVLAILGLVMAIGLQSTGAYLSNEKRKTTTARLAGIDAAMINFVAQQRRLPCPANGAVATGTAGAGVEQRNANGTCIAAAIAAGVVPWITLGISEADAQDGWSNRITYRTVSATVGANNFGFTSNQALDMTECDPAGTGGRADRSFGTPAQTVSTCIANGSGPPAPAPAPPPFGPCNLANLNSDSRNCTSPTRFLAGRGIMVRDGAAPYPGNPIMDPRIPNPPPAPPLPPAPPNDISNGAAYVLISHGDNAAGAYNSAGIIQVGGGPAPGAGETQNRNNNAMQAFYVDAQFSDGPVAAHFDDIISRPSLMSIITKAQLGPRAHLQ